MPVPRVPDDHVPPSGEHERRRSWAKHRAQNRAANAARYRALQRLIEAHPVEYAVIYAEKAAEAGVTPHPRNEVSVQDMEAQLADLQAALDRTRRDQDDGG
jgi:hypothetical protein